MFGDGRVGQCDVPSMNSCDPLHSHRRHRPFASDHFFPKCVLSVVSPAVKTAGVWLLLPTDFLKPDSIVCNESVAAIWQRKCDIFRAAENKQDNGVTLFF